MYDYACIEMKTCKTRLFHWYYLLTGDRRQARHFYLAKQFCFLDADCLVVGESQGSSRRSVGKYPVKPPRPEGDIPMQEPLIFFSIIDIFTGDASGIRTCKVEVHS